MNPLPLRVGDIFRSDQFDMTVKVLKFCAGHKIRIEYTRNGHTEIFEALGESWVPSLMNDQLFVKD